MLDFCLDAGICWEVSLCHVWRGEGINMDPRKYMKLNVNTRIGRKIKTLVEISQVVGNGDDRMILKIRKVAGRYCRWQKKYMLYKNMKSYREIRQLVGICIISAI